MSRPPANAHDVETPERVLTAAEAAFAADGFRGARLEDIAAAASIRRSSLLYHFGTKEALYEAVVRRAFADLAAALVAGMDAPGGFAERLEATERAWLGFLDARPGFAALLLREILDGQGPGRELLLELMVPMLDGVERFIDEQGRAEVRVGIPVRALLLQVASSALVRSAAGPLRDPIWGPGAAAPVLARRLFLRDSPAWPDPTRQE